MQWWNGFWLCLYPNLSFCLWSGHFMPRRGILLEVLFPVPWEEQKLSTMLILFARFLECHMLDWEYMSLRCDLLFWNLSLKRPFKGYVDCRMPMGWASHRHIAWQSSAECSITCYASLSCHRVDIEMRYPIMRRSWWIWSLLGDKFIWDIWWWCIWLLAMREHD